jgi:phosphopantothenoylcysteine decarboxylase/phosphopantothenate--cysteine ligase
MSEPAEILSALRSALTPKDLEGRHLVVSAGPTRELVDPVRFLSNRSSGKMGFAVAAQARERGARVTLVAGPVERETPRGVERVDVVSALEMHDALVLALGADLSGADALVMTAAVADYRVAQPSTDKIKRGNDAIAIELLPNPDILANIGRLREGRSPVLVGFALDTALGSQLIATARQKLINKRVDMIVANSSEALEGNQSSAMFVGVRDCIDMGHLRKTDLANKILDWIAEKLRETAADEATE